MDNLTLPICGGRLHEVLQSNKIHEETMVEKPQIGDIWLTSIYFPFLREQRLTAVLLIEPKIISSITAKSDLANFDIIKSTVWNVLIVGTTDIRDVLENDLVDKLA